MLKDYQLFTNLQRKLKTYTQCSQLFWDNTITQTKVMTKGTEDNAPETQVQKD